MHEDIYKNRKELSIYWFNKASDLMGSAGALWACQDGTRSSEVVEELGLWQGYSMGVATPPVYRMLCGMALELIYKAIIVAKGENVPETHRLIDLAQKAEVEVKEKQKGLLQVLTESIIWDGRYPTPKKEAHMESLYNLTCEHLYDKEPLGSMHILKPNKALGWEGFVELWGTANEVYWPLHS